MNNYILPTKNTWCPGCGNFGIQHAINNVLQQINRDNTVLVSGIGCHGKISDYMDISSFYALHGRAIPAASGVKMGNRDLDVICCVGDGDAYNEGVAHLIHSARRNSDITVIVHDNHVFSLTVKQVTATSPKGFVASTTPKGNTDDPINPLEMMFSAGATFIARGYTGKIEHLGRIILEGVKHKGFSFIEVLQPCVAWYNTYPDYNQRVYEMEEEYLDIKRAKEKIEEWDYRNDNNIPLGVFYKEEKQTYEEQLGDVFSPSVEEFLQRSK